MHKEVYEDLLMWRISHFVILLLEVKENYREKSFHFIRIYLLLLSLNI